MILKIIRLTAIILMIITLFIALYTITIDKNFYSQIKHETTIKRIAINKYFANLNEYSKHADTKSLFIYSIVSAKEIIIDKDPTNILDYKIEQFDDKIIVTWRSNHLATSKISYGRTSNLSATKEDLIRTHNHKIVLENISPNTLYYFEISGSAKNLVTLTNLKFTTSDQIY